VTAVQIGVRITLPIQLIENRLPFDVFLFEARFHETMGLLFRSVAPING
jgi:hypothetical protein